MRILLTMSLTGSAMILVVALLRYFLHRYLHRSVFVLLWGLVLLRLSLPISVPAQSSIYNYILPTQAVVESYASSSPVQSTVAVEVVLAQGQPVPVIRPADPEPARILPWVWVGGCGLCLLYILVSHIRGRAGYRFAIPEPEEALKGARIYRLEGLPGPMVYGLLRPKVLLPSNFPEKGSEEYWHVLHHELQHIQNRDLWIKLFALLVVCVHWFNPFAWLLLVMLSEDLEMRCDQQVIAAYGKKKGYARTLVLAQTNKLNHLLETCFAFSATEKRLENIAKAKLHPVRSILIGVLVAVILLACLATVRIPVSANEGEMSMGETQPTESTVTVEAPSQAPSEGEERASKPLPLPTEKLWDRLPETEPAPTEETLPEETEAPTETTTQAPGETTVQQTEAPETQVPTEPVVSYPYVGSVKLKVGESMTFKLGQKYTVSSSDPSVVRGEYLLSSLGSEFYYQLIITAYQVGNVHIYADDGSSSWVIATVTVEPDGQTTEVGFGELDGQAPSVQIPNLVP